MDENILKQIFLDYHIVQDYDELLWLCKIVEPRIRKPGAILEIGTECGGTLRVWQHLIDTKGLLIGIDTLAKPEIPIQDNIYFGFIRGRSSDAETISGVRRFLDAFHWDSIDFLFIDADHTEEAVRKDFLNYSPFVREGGVIGFHDIGDTNNAGAFFNTLEKNKTVSINLKIGTGVYFK